MKSLQIWFEDADFARLQRTKGAMTWREFVLSVAKEKQRAEPTASPAPAPKSAPGSKEETSTD